MRRLGLGTALLLTVAAAGCAVQPASLADQRLRYNETVKSTAEQQLLLNIVRLRYADSPSSLAISNIATQSEVVRSLGLLPFFGAVGGELQVQSVSRVLPMGQVAVVDRPTVSLTPLDDAEFTRRLFTPMTMEGVLYLARATWPIATVFRLWLENLNWVPNAESASGPLERRVPDFARFRSGVEALQALQDAGKVVFMVEERDEPVGGPLPATAVRPRDVVAAAKEGLELRPDAGGATWSVVRRRMQPTLRIDPQALQSPEMNAFTEAFRLARDRHTFDIDIGRLEPFPSRYPAGGVERIDLETRSLLQVLYFMAKGVEVPASHRAARLVVPALDEAGQPFDWRRVTGSLFTVRVADGGGAAPAGAHVSVRYRDHWYYVDQRDADSMSTFSLVMALSRLELSGGRAAGGPTLTLPLTGR